MLCGLFRERPRLCWSLYDLFSVFLHFIELNQRRAARGVEMGGPASGTWLHADELSGSWYYEPQARAVPETGPAGSGCSCPLQTSSSPLTRINPNAR